MKVGNWDFVSEVMQGSVYYSFDNLFDNCYYDNSKMVIEVLIENNIKLDADACNCFIGFVTENITEILKRNELKSY